VIRFQDDFGVAVGEEAIALALQLRAQLAEIIDAAVESDSEPKLVVGHRLLRGGCQIKDAETPVAERLPALREHAGRIRPARAHGFRHRRERSKRHLAPRPDFPAYSAHFLSDRRPDGVGS
jgi:hypothetical protein